MRNAKLTKASPSKAKQSNAKQSKVKPSRANQSKQSKAKPSKAKQSQAKQCKAKQINAKQSKRSKAKQRIAKLRNAKLINPKNHKHKTPFHVTHLLRSSGMRTTRNWGRAPPVPPPRKKHILKKRPPGGRGKRPGYTVKHFTRFVLLIMEYSVDADARDRSMETLRRGDPRPPPSRHVSPADSTTAVSPVLPLGSPAVSLASPPGPAAVGLVAPPGPNAHPFMGQPLSHFLRWTPDERSHCRPIEKIIASELAEMYHVPCSILSCCACMVQGTVKKKKVRGSYVIDDSGLRALLAADVKTLTHLQKTWIKTNTVARPEEENMDADRFAPQPACIVKYIRTLATDDTDDE